MFHWVFFKLLTKNHMIWFFLHTHSHVKSIFWCWNGEVLLWVSSVRKETQYWQVHIMWRIWSLEELSFIQLKHMKLGNPDTQECCFQQIKLCGSTHAFHWSKVEPRVHVLRTDLYDNVPNGSYAPSLVTGEKQYLSVTLRIKLFISFRNKFI